MTQPPGTGSWPEQFADLRRQFAELTRKAPVLPHCTVRMSSDVPLSVWNDHPAGGHWVAFEDEYGMFAPGDPCFITVAPAGYWLLHYHAQTDGISTATVPAYANAKIWINGFGSAVAMDMRNYPPSGSSDGAVCDPIRTKIYLNEGDQVYWSNLSSIPSNINATAHGSVPTEMVVRYIGTT